MRVRTIDAGFDELKRKDPKTAVTRSGFRRLVVSQQISSVRVGKKYLVDLDAVEEYFRCALFEKHEVKGEPDCSGRKI